MLNAGWVMFAVVVVLRLIRWALVLALMSIGALIAVGATWAVLGINSSFFGEYAASYWSDVAWWRWMTVLLVAPGAVMLFRTIARMVAVSIMRTERDLEASAFLAAAMRGRSWRRGAVTLLRSFHLDERFGDRAAEKKVDQFGRPLEAAISGAISAAALSGRGVGQMFIAFAADLNAKDRRFETKLRKAVEQLRPRPVTCSIGRGQDSFGFGRIRSRDDNWKSVAAALLENSAIVLMMYGVSAGTSWELDKLIGSSELRARTIFLIPPADTLVRT